MRILGFGTYDITRHPRIGIILEGMRSAGDEVTEANSPLRISTAERVEMLRKPWLAYRLIVEVLRGWLVITVAATRARRRGSFDAVLVGYMGHFDVVLARLLFPRTKIVLDQLIFAADTARDRGVNGSWKAGILRTIDSVATACADVIVVDTHEHLALIAPSRRSRAVVVPVGALSEWFEVAGGSSGDRLQPLRVVFFGLFTPLQGAPVVGAALGLLADYDGIEATMIGRGQDFAAARAAAVANRRVLWRDWIEPDDLPATVAAHDVCLGIFGTTPKARRVVPNKVYQGAAAGCAIVTSETPPQLTALKDAATFVSPGDAEALAAALRRLAADRALVADRATAASERARHDFTPSAVAGHLRPFLTSPTPGRRSHSR